MKEAFFGCTDYETIRHVEAWVTHQSLELGDDYEWDEYVVKDFNIPTDDKVYAEKCYRKDRENGLESDSPVRKFPSDGKCRWVTVEQRGCNIYANVAFSF